MTTQGTAQHLQQRTVSIRFGMTLLERLRKWSKMTVPSPWWADAVSDCGEAADEIERLRRALKAIHTYSGLDEGELHEVDACGVDACILCLIEATAQDALEGKSDE